MTEPKRILFRGVPMIEGWSERIMAAQQMVSLTKEGQTVPRVRYGDEQDDWGANLHACADCAVLKREFHALSCDGEECSLCGGQLISCDCGFDELAENG